MLMTGRRLFFVRACPKLQVSTYAQTVQLRKPRRTAAIAPACGARRRPKCSVGVNMVTRMCESVLDYAPKSPCLGFWWQHGGPQRAARHFWGRPWEVLGGGERPQNEPKTTIRGILRGPGTAPELAVHSFRTGRSLKGQNVVFHI